MPANVKIDRAALEASAASVIEKSRVRLLLDTKDTRSVFFAALGMRLLTKADWSFPTAAVDGKTLFYNPAFVVKLPEAEWDGVHIHEILHCANAHHARRGDRDPWLWNIACDLAINQIVLDCGMNLPKGALMVGRGDFASFPRGLAAEQYYDLLMQGGFGKKPKEDGEEGGSGDGDQEGDGEGSGGDAGDGMEGDGGKMPAKPKKRGSKPGKGSGEPSDEQAEGKGGESHDPGQCGGVIDAPNIEGSSAAAGAAEAEWQVAVAEAAEIARQRGDLPGSLATLVERIVHPKETWQEELREFCGRTLDAKDDYTWQRPNRRFISQGLYLPSLASESIGHIVIAVDTSGSTQPYRAIMAAEMTGILEARPAKVTIVHCDCRIAHVEEWQREDGPLNFDKFYGNGGTIHVPVWQWIAEQDEPCDAVVCLTDGETDFGKPPVDVPVLWAMVKNVVPPFGRAIYLQPKQG